MAEVIAFASALNAVDGSHHRHRNLPDFDRPRGAARVRLWLQADLQSPEIDFRFAPDSRRFEAHAGLPLLTQAVSKRGHRDQLRNN